MGCQAFRCADPHGAPLLWRTTIAHRTRRARPLPRRGRDGGRTRGGRSRARIALAILLVGAPLAAWILMRFVPGRPRTSATRPVVVDSLEATHPGAAYDTALARARRGGSSQSLPYYARALRGVASDFWEIHDN